MVKLISSMKKEKKPSSKAYEYRFKTNNLLLLYILQIVSSGYNNPITQKKKHFGLSIHQKESLC